MNGCLSLNATRYKSTPSDHTSAIESCFPNFSCSGDIRPKCSKETDTHLAWKIILSSNFDIFKLSKSSNRPLLFWLMWFDVKRSLIYCRELGILVIIEAMWFRCPVKMNSVNKISSERGLLLPFKVSNISSRGAVRFTIWISLRISLLPLSSYLPSFKCSVRASINPS